MPRNTTESKKSHGENTKNPEDRIISALKEQRRHQQGALLKIMTSIGNASTGNDDSSKSKNKQRKK